MRRSNPRRSSHTMRAMTRRVPLWLKISLDALADRLGASLLAAIRGTELSCSSATSATFSSELVCGWRAHSSSPGSLADCCCSSRSIPSIFAGALWTGHHIIGGTEYMFDPHLPLLIRLVSLFHVATPPLLLWGIWRLGYDRRGWKFQTLTAWIVVPINYFWRPEQDVNWARGLFFHEQHADPRLGIFVHLSDCCAAVRLFPDTPFSDAAHPALIVSAAKRAAGQ